MRFCRSSTQILRAEAWFMPCKCAAIQPAKKKKDKHGQPFDAVQLSKLQTMNVTATRDAVATRLTFVLSGRRFRGSRSAALPKCQEASCRSVHSSEQAGLTLPVWYDLVLLPPIASLRFQFDCVLRERAVTVEWRCRCPHACPDTSEKQGPGRPSHTSTGIVWHCFWGCCRIVCS